MILNRRVIFVTFVKRNLTALKSNHKYSQKCCALILHDFQSLMCGSSLRFKGSKALQSNKFFFGQLVLSCRPVVLLNKLEL